MPILTESRSNQRDQGPGGGTTRAMVGSPPRMPRPVPSLMAVSHCTLREERPPLTPPGGVGFASSVLRRRCVDGLGGRAGSCRPGHLLGVRACSRQVRQVRQGGRVASPLTYAYRSAIYLQGTWSGCLSLPFNFNGLARPPIACVEVFIPPMPTGHFVFWFRAGFAKQALRLTTDG